VVSRRALVVLVALCAPAHADPVATWVSNDELVGTLRQGGKLDVWGAGLAARYEPWHHLALGVDGAVLRLDGDAPHDDRRGFALRAGAIVAYAIDCSHRAGIAWRIVPEAGVTGAVLYGLGADSRTQDAWWLGARATFSMSDPRPRGAGEARGVGGHVELRVAPADRTWTFSIGYDWGL